MSFDDDATDDSAGFRPPPHIDDRLWRHPSEVGRARAAALPAVRSATTTTSHSHWGTLAVAAAGIALVAAGASVMTMGLQEQAAQTSPLQQAAISPLSGDPTPTYGFTTGTHSNPEPGQLDAAQGLAPAIVRVDTGTTRGSGVVLTEDGVVVTSIDVVGLSAFVAVGMADGRLLTGRTVALDPLTGLAVVDLTGDGYDTIPVAEPPSDLAGGPSMALGVDESGRVLIAPGQLDAQPTMVERPGNAALDGILVLDAVTHPLARGGPVVDEAGDLVGVTTWTDATNSYATPIGAILNLVDDLHNEGRPDHTWLGIVGANAPADPVAPAGVEIADVMVDGPCVSILLPGDRIVALDDQPVDDMSALVAELREHDPGDSVPLTYWRRDRHILATEDVVLAQRPADVG